MEYNVNGTMIEADKNGYLVDIDEWNEDVAQVIAAQDGIELTDKHWDLVKYLREEFVENRGNQPNTRTIIKAMQEAWGDKTVDSKALYDLFPKDPSKQAGRIAGLPESKRKGGY